MAEFSSPWNLTPTVGDAQTYSATEFADYFNQIAVGEGANLFNRGVVRGFNNGLEVLATSPTSTSVNVSTGAAFVQGIGYTNSAVVTLPIAANGSGLTRIDTIVLRTQFNNSKTVRLAVSQGTPGGGKKGLQQVAGSIWEIPLAYVTLANGFSAIAQTAIEDAREYVNIPSALGIRAVNGSGGSLVQGNVVVWSGAGFTTTTTEANGNVAGVVEAYTLNGASGRVITEGYSYVLCDESVAAGDYLITSTTAGQAQKVVGNSGTPFARVLIANSGAGTAAFCYIRVQMATYATPATRAIKGSTQALAATTDTQITFSGTSYDDLVWFNNAADSITVTQTGRYEIMLYTPVDTALTHTTAIKVGGVLLVASTLSSGTNFYAAVAQVYWQGPLTAGNVITGHVYASGICNVTTACYLLVRRVG